MLAKNLLKNFIFLLGGSIVGQIFYFIAIIYLARILGPAGFGHWNFAQALMLYLFRINEIGLEVTGIREVSRFPSDTSLWISNITIIRLALAIFLFIIISLFSWGGFFPVQSSKLVILFSLAVFPTAITLEWVFEAHQNLRIVGLSRIIKGLVFFLLILFLVNDVHDIELSIIAYVVSLCIPVLIIAWILLKRYKWSSSKEFISSAKIIIWNTLPIGVATILLQYCLFLATIILGYQRSDLELGYYTAAHRLVVFVWAYVMVSANRVLLPTLSRYHSESHDAFSMLVAKYFRLSTIVIIPIGLIAVALADVVLPLLYTAMYNQSIYIFKILICAMVIALVRSIFEIALIASDRQRSFLVNMIFLAVTYSIITPFMIFQYGIVGAAISAVIAEISGFVFMIVKYPVSDKMKIVNPFLKSIGAGLLSVCTLLIIPESQIVLRLLLCLSVYIYILVLLKVVSSKDWNYIVNIFQKKEETVFM